MSTQGVEVVIAEDSRIQAKILERRLTEAGIVFGGGTDGQAARTLSGRAPAIVSGVNANDDRL